MDKAKTTGRVFTSKEEVMKTYFPEWEQINQDKISKELKDLEFVLEELPVDSMDEKPDEHVMDHSKKNTKGIFHFLKKTRKSSH
jgi:hypothetical protein